MTERLRLMFPVLAALAFAALPTHVGAQPEVPRLVVNIVVDQLRTDYMQAFLPLCGEDGFKRLLNQGRVFTQGEYPLVVSDRAAAIASLVTGTSPSDHGIIGQTWLSRESLQTVNCVDDAKYAGVNTTGGTSPKYLAVSTIADELKVATSGKSLVYAIAPYRDAAVLSAGHAADGVLWIDEYNGSWASSNYYAFPVWGNARNKVSPLAEKLKKHSWQPYSDLVGTFSYFLGGGMREPFEHKFKGDSLFLDFLYSALVNEEVADMAYTCINSSSVGLDDTPDYLALTFYAGQSNMGGEMELQDTYVRLDHAIASVITAAENKVGQGNVLFVLTSTGYYSEEGSDLAPYHIPTGSFDIRRTAALLNMYLVAVYGQAQWVEGINGTQIYLDHKLLESRQVSLTDILERSQDLLIQLSGVKDVFTAQRLIQGAWTPGIARYRAAYNPQFSGDITIQVAPGWQWYDTQTNQREYVRQSYVPFPIIFMGSGIQSDSVETVVSVDRIAPTVSKALRIRAPNACAAAPLF